MKANKVKGGIKVTTKMIEAGRTVLFSWRDSVDDDCIVELYNEMERARSEGDHENSATPSRPSRSR